MSAKIIIGSAFLAGAIATAAHADELSDIQAQAKQLREQMTRRLADLEKRQKALEAAKPVAIICRHTVGAYDWHRNPPSQAQIFSGRVGFSNIGCTRGHWLG